MVKYIVSENNTRIKDYTGMKKNKLTAIAFSHTTNSLAFWFFMCDCGRKKIIRPSKVFSKNGTTKSCGCLKGKYENNGITKIFASYKKNAKIRNLVFNLSIEDFSRITSEKCHYCNILPSRLSKSKYNIYLYNGIDRKNNKIGYELNNCLPCCTLCNKAKRDLDYDIFIEWINRFKK